MTNEFPWGFNLQRIKKHVDYYLENGRISKAIELLEKVEDLWIEKKPNINDSRYEHLMDYHLENFFLQEGQEYFLVKVREMIAEIKGLDGPKLHDGVREVPINENDETAGVTVKRLALFLYYQNKLINHHDFNTIAKAWGYHNGNRLRSDFSVFRERQRRVGSFKDLNTHVQILNRVKDFEWVLQRLPEEFKGKAEDDLKSLKMRLTIEE